MQTGMSRQEPAIFVSAEKLLTVGPVVIGEARFRFEVVNICLVFVHGLTLFLSELPCKNGE